MNKKIFIILPHKDQFIKNYAGSASIWVKDFFQKSILLNKTPNAFLFTGIRGVGKLLLLEF